MTHVPQEHHLGCLIAATAMVLDLTYADVARTIPLQYTPGEAWWQSTLTRLQALAATRDQVIVDLPLPFVVQPGLRYLLQIPTAIPNYTHVLAIDENGVAYDPDDPATQRHWSEYNVLALIEFKFRA
jgi:hypothetical protein